MEKVQPPVPTPVLDPYIPPGPPPPTPKVPRNVIREGKRGLYKGHKERKIRRRDLRWLRGPDSESYRAERVMDEERRKRKSFKLLDFSRAKVESSWLAKPHTNPTRMFGRHWTQMGKEKRKEKTHLLKEAANPLRFPPTFQKHAWVHECVRCDVSSLECSLKK